MSVPRNMTVASSVLLAISAVTFATTHHSQTGEQETVNDEKMLFGSFSVSLAVKDISASKAFYEKLDFQQVGGNLEQNWVILRSGTTTIGLFQGMFEENILTFNPGWDHNAEPLNQFQDVRDLQATLKQRGITPVTEADTTGDGPASFVIVDPDGNLILVDQHVAKPTAANDR